MIRQTLDAGINVAIVFPILRTSDDLPQFLTLQGQEFPVIDGDTHDLRFLDPSGCIVGLRYKGSAAQLTADCQKGFVWQP